MNEIRDFFYGQVPGVPVKDNLGQFASIYLHVRWRFVDSIGSHVPSATEEENPFGLPVKLVEFLSVDVTFYSNNAYWSWYTKTQNEVMDRMYRAARNGTSSRLIKWLGGFDLGRSTTKDDRKEFLKGLVELNNSIITIAHELHVLPVWPGPTR